MKEQIKHIMQVGKVKSTHLSKRIGISEFSLRRMLRGEVDMSVEVAEAILKELGYKLIILKKEHEIL